MSLKVLTTGRYVTVYDTRPHNCFRNRARNWVHSRIWRSRDCFLSTSPTRKTAIAPFLRESVYRTTRAVSPHDRGACLHLLCSSSPLPPSPPAEKATASQDQTGKASTDDGARRQEAPDLAARKHSRMDVEIGLSGRQSPKQSRLGARGSTTVSRDEGRVVCRRHRQIQNLRKISGGNPQGQIRKCWHHGGNPGRPGERRSCAAMDV